MSPRPSPSPAATRARLFFLFAAFVSFVFSVVLWFMGSRQEAIFVGIWVPSILSFGTLVLGGRWPS